MNAKLCMLLALAGLPGALGLLGGCGGEEEPEPALGRDGFCAAWASAACSAATVSACQAASVEACRAEQQEVCLDLVGNDFVDNAANTCLNGVELAYQDADLTADELKLLKLGGACAKVVSGEGDEGDTCSEDRDCNRSLDLECVSRDGTTGTCQVAEEIEAGRSCADPEDVCESGFFCSMDFCLERYEDEEACSYSGQCNSDAFCNTEGGSADGGSAGGVCEPRRPVDAACTADEQCDSGVCYEFANGDTVCIDRLRLSRSEPICSTLR